MDLKKGFDRTLDDQVLVAKIQQKLGQERAIQNQVIIQQCLQMRAHLTKKAYADLMYIFGCGYASPKSDQSEGQVQEVDKDFEVAKKTFAEDVMPALSENMGNVCRQLRLVL